MTENADREIVDRDEELSILKVILYTGVTVQLTGSLSYVRTSQGSEKLPSN
tara:strand:+ start:22 stop:174 length:153 start_codon:yes stop_codon:yes gene_type:complete